MITVIMMSLQMLGQFVPAVLQEADEVGEFGLGQRIRQADRHCREFGWNLVFDLHPLHPDEGVRIEQVVDDLQLGGSFLDNHARDHLAAF